MLEGSIKKEGRYIYAIIIGSKAKSYGAIGIEGSIVHLISSGSVSAVVSDVLNRKTRPERRHLAAHQEVLNLLLKETTPLPMSFGTIANGEETIRNILSRNQESFLEQLHRVANKVEMGLRVARDVPNIFDHFVHTYPELRAARDRFFTIHRQPTQDEKIELGRLFESILNEDRETFTEKVEGVLTRYCFEIKRNKCRNEREVMNLACLVGRRERTRFEAGVFETARMFDNNFTFDYNGPWAPHNFVDIDLNLSTLKPNTQQVENADY